MQSQCLTIAVLLLLSLTVLPQQGQTQPPTKHDDITKLLTITGARSIGLRASVQVLEMYKQTNTDIPPEVWQEILHDAEARVDEFMTERLVPIYDQYLSHEDIKGLIAFYESPLGKKLLQAMPLMSQESRIAGQTWGRDFAEDVRKKLVARGIISP